MDSSSWCCEVQLTRPLLEALLGMPINNFPGQYVQAFTHKSSGLPANYERLEFLGDACLSMITAKHLFDSYSQEQEGFLTRLRTRLTCSSTLAHLGRSLGLHRYIVVSARAMEKQFHTNDKILEDVFEALIGALYLDLGLAITKNFFLGLVEQYIDNQALVVDVNYKDQLMRHAQQLKTPMPDYGSEKIPVGDGKWMYTVTAMWNGVSGRALHNTKKGAEQKAARLVLLQIGAQRQQQHRCTNRGPRRHPSAPHT